jgi:hypothetical protein
VTRIDPANLYILNDAGEPEPAPSVLTWGQWMQTHQDARVVGEDLDEGDPATTIRISTLFMGVDLRLLPTADAPPLLWETMVFAPGPTILAQDRYTSRAAAIAGHQAMCRRVTARSIPSV